MELNRTSNLLDRDARISENENWDRIEGSVKKVGDKVDNFIEETSEDAFNKIIDNVKLNWKEPVENFNDLPSSASEGDARMARDTGKVYRFDGSIWKEIQQIDAGPVNELDSRLSEQLADIRNLENFEINSKTRKKQGITVFTSDDIREEEYTVAKDIFGTEGVPQTIYAVSNSVDKAGFLSREQMLELQNELGWEIGSHSKSHPAPFPNVSDEQAEIEFRDSKQELESMGFVINNYSYVGGNYGKRERLLARKYYRSARCSDRDNKGTNDSPLNTYELKTIWVDPETAPLKQWLIDYPRSTAIQMMYDFAKETIDLAETNNSIAIISTHFRNIDTQDLKDLYRDVIRYSKQKTEVLTMNDALNRMGNIVDIGDYSQTGQRAKNGSHFVVGADGLTSGSYSITERDRFSALSSFTDYPFGVTVTPLSYSNREGTPEDYSGILTTHRYDDKEGSVNKQEYMSFRTKNEYVRYVNDQNEFESWELNTVTLRDAVYTPSSLPSEFPSGVNVVRVTTNSSGLSQTPTGRRGKIVNIKPEKGGNSVAYNQQIYYEIETRDTYTRYAESDDTWSGWVKDNYFKLPGYNTFNLETVFNDFPLGVTYSIITTDLSNDAPNNRRGTLVTYKLTSNTQQSYSYQEYLSDNGDTFRRHPTGSTSWSSWHTLK